MYEITKIRAVPSDDDSHMHVEQVGYISGHMPGEAILISIPRAIQKIAFGEAFCITIDGEQVPVTPGKCALCGHEPYLSTPADKGKDSVLLGLNRI